MLSPVSALAVFARAAAETGVLTLKGTGSSCQERLRTSPTPQDTNSMGQRHLHQHLHHALLPAAALRLGGRSMTTQPTE